MSSFGWSFGDIATACTIILHIIKAFDNAKGANKQYRDSHAFLCGLYLVVNYVSDDTKAASLPGDAREQVASISSAYMDLHAYVLKHAKLVDPDRNRLKAILPTISWSMHELNHKVQNLKLNSLNAIAIMETLIVMNLSSRVNTLVEMGDRQEHSLETATVVLYDVREQLASLSQVSEEYRKLLDESNQNDASQALDLISVEERLNNISRSQEDLQKNLDNLMKHLEERSRNDQAQQEEWQALIKSEPAPSIMDKNLEQTQTDLRNTNELIGGVGAVTGNSRIQHMAVRGQGIGQIFGAITPLTGRFGFGRNQPPEPPQTTATKPTSTSRMIIPPSKREYKPAPVVTTPPPPRRIPPLTQNTSPGSISAPQYRRPTSSSQPSSSRELMVVQEQTNSRRNPQQTAQERFPSAALPKILEVSSLNAPPLPPRHSSVSAVPSTNNSAMDIVEKRPELPPRSYTQSNSTSAINVVEATPELPRRNYTQSVSPMPSPPIERNIRPTKPQHLRSGSSSLTATPGGQMSPISRVSSASSSNSAVTGTYSITSSISSNSTAPSTSPTSPFMSELQRKLDLRQQSAKKT